MRRAIWRWILLGSMMPVLGGCINACSKEGRGGDDDDDFVPSECDAGTAAFARNATLAVLGRRTFGQFEVNGLLVTASNAGVANARDAIVEVLATDNREDYVDRWAEAIMDHLRVPRVDDQEMSSCYGTRTLDRIDDGGALARYVRDNEASDTGDGNGTFTMRNLLESSIDADDLSPVYRAHLFAMISRPIPAANVPQLEAELAHRQDFGLVFDAVYLNRDHVCLGCHNSQFSVTDGDGDDDRHWPIRGSFEDAIWGAANGGDAAAAHAMFRCEDFLGGAEGNVCYTAGGTEQEPWGWSSNCGSFIPDPPSDPAGINVNFATLSGDATTVYDLEAALMRGIDVLAADGLELDGAGVPVDSEAAFAYLVGASISEMVWKEIVGTPLTIANYFPRNEASRDELARITDAFVESHFSLRTVIEAVLRSPYVNQSAPVAGCGTAYSMPAVFDPWVLGESDADLRRNSPADGVSALQPHVATRAASRALGWAVLRHRSFPDYPVMPGDPVSPELAMMRGIGAFTKNSDPGFRGLDFQARLVWEDRFANCTPDPSEEPDWLDGLLTSAATESADVRELVLAMKDRFVNEASIDVPSGEEAAVEALFGVDLDEPVSAVGAPAALETAARRFCGVLLSSPQFLLAGLPDPEVAPPPRLNPGP